MASRYTLYITNKNYSSWSLRLWLLMRKLHLPFTEKLVPIVEAETQDHFFAFSPTGKVPCLHDDAPAGSGSEGPPLVVCESLAIAEYLAETHPDAGGWPADARARAWARQAAGEMVASFHAVRDLLSFNIGVRVRLSDGETAPGTRLRRDLDRLDALWADGLARFGGPWLAGPGFTAVDAFYAPVAFRIQTFGVELATPACRAYVERLLALDEMRLWDDESRRETWREAGHERDSIRDRVVLQDYRATE